MSREDFAEMNRSLLSMESAAAQIKHKSLAICTLMLSDDNFREMFTDPVLDMYADLNGVLFDRISYDDFRLGIQELKGKVEEFFELGQSSRN